jgi:hypothetical protein
MQQVVRVKPTELEMAALDISIHGEVAYKIDMSEMSPTSRSQSSPTRKEEAKPQPPAAAM